MNHGSTMKSLQDFKKDVRKQITALKKHRELQKYMTRFNAKKRLLARNVKRTINTEIKNANKFLQAKQRELDNFQKQIKSTIKRKIKSSRH